MCDDEAYMNAIAIERPTCLRLTHPDIASLVDPLSRKRQRGCFELVRKILILKTIQSKKK